MPEQGITVKGASVTALHVKNFEREIFDVLSKQVKDILKRTQAGAKARYPQGSWSVSFGGARWPAGEVSTSGGSSSGFSSWADAPGGVKASIFDTYGRRTSPSVMATAAARATGVSLRERYGTSQRFLWPAFAEHGAESRRAITEAFEGAERKLQSKLDGAH